MVVHCEICLEVHKSCGDGYCNECGGRLCNCDDGSCALACEEYDVLFSIARTLRRIEKSLKGR